MSLIDYIAEYWASIIGVAVALFTLFFALGKLEKEKVLNWLVYAVTAAEKDLGTKTGKLKLRTVYERFVGAFPIFSLVLPFSTFSEWVDIALDEMKKMLENAAIKNYVEGEKK